MSFVPKGQSMKNLFASSFRMAEDSDSLKEIVQEERAHSDEEDKDLTKKRRHTMLEPKSNWK